MLIRAYLRVRTIILHERMLNLNTLLRIARGNSSIDIIELVDRQVRVEFVQLLELAERLEVVDACRLGLGLDRARNGCDFLGLAALAEKVGSHCGERCARV